MTQHGAAKSDLRASPAERRPSICFIAPNAYPLLARVNSIEVIGGAELQQVTIAKGLARRGYRVSMVCLDYGQPEEHTIDGVQVLRAFRRDDGIPALRFVHPRLTSLWRCLRKADADIYYQRTAGMLTGVVARYTRHSGKKSVFAAAGNPDLELPTSRIRYARDRWLYEYGLRNVDQVLVQNEEQAQLCQRNFRREAIPVPNCYSPPASGRRTSDAKVVLWVSTIRALKRPQLFLELARRLPRNRFRMIGGASRDEAGLFESVRTTARVMSNVEFMGFLPYEETERHFDEALLFVNTSESEGFPNTFLQAWARGIPTVSFVDSGARLGGTPPGLVVGSGSMPALVSAVSSVLDDEQARAEHASRCLRYFNQHHGTEHVLDIYENIFGTLMHA